VEFSAQFCLLHSPPGTSPYVGDKTRKRLTGKRFLCDSQAVAKNCRGLCAKPRGIGQASLPSSKFSLSTCVTHAGAKPVDPVQQWLANLHRKL
jgi:hypothetical protein